MTTKLRVSPAFTLDAWYDKPSRTWWAAYYTPAGDQHGPAWHGATRDEVLIFRPSIPADYHIDEKILTAFGTGYYDGRAHGVEKPFPGEEDDLVRHYYRRGYDRGVFDFCELDAGT